jgi:hypothetical protein
MMQDTSKDLTSKNERTKSTREHVAITASQQTAGNSGAGSKGDDLGNDLAIGMRAIAGFWGMPERKAYYLASRGLLPGVFQINRQWIGCKSVSRDAIKAKAIAASGP